MFKRQIESLFLQFSWKYSCTDQKHWNLECCNQNYFKTYHFLHKQIIENSWKFSIQNNHIFSHWNVCHFEK